MGHPVLPLHEVEELWEPPVVGVRETACLDSVVEGLAFQVQEVEDVLPWLDAAPLGIRVEFEVATFVEQVTINAVWLWWLWRSVLSPRT